jgi:hypothetical protein
MYYSTINQLVTLTVTGSTAGFAVGDDIVVQSSTPKTNIRIAGFTGNNGRTLLVKLTSSSVAAAAITPNSPFIKGDYIYKVSNPSLTAAVHSDNWITQTAAYPYTSQDATWYGEPSYNPARHELFTYSNGTHGVPTGYNSSFYQGTMFALTGTDMSCILMLSRPNVPFGWWNGLGSRLSCLLTRQHMLKIAHYPCDANELKCVSSDGTVHTVRGLTRSQHLSSVGVVIPDDGSFPTGLSACGNGIMVLNQYPNWYKLKTGREIYEDYDLDPTLFSTTNFSTPFSEYYIQTFKTALPTTVKPILMPTINCEKQFKVSTVKLGNYDETLTLLSVDSNQEDTTKSNLIREIYDINPQHLEDTTENLAANLVDPYINVTNRFRNNGFYAYLNEMPVMVINNTFARGFVRRSKLTGMSVSRRPITTSITIPGRLYTESFSFIHGLNFPNSFSANKPWNGFSYFEADQGSYLGQGDSGSLAFIKRNNRLVMINSAFSASNVNGLDTNLTDCIGTSYDGSACNQFDSKSYSVMGGNRVGFSHELKYMMEIMLADKSWQVTNETINNDNSISNDYKIFESDLTGNHAIEWYDFADELAPLYQTALARRYGDSEVRDAELPNVVTYTEPGSIPIKNKPYEMETPDSVGAVAKQPPNTNLAIQSNFKFSLKRVPELSYFCTSISLPGWSNPIITVPGGVPGGRKNLRVKSESITHGEATFKFLVNEDMSNYDALMRWFKECIGFTDYSPVSYKNWMSEEGHLLVLNNKKKPVFKITFRGLFPTNVSELAFKANETEAAPMTATVTMAFTYFNVERIVNQ